MKARITLKQILSFILLILFTILSVAGMPEMIAMLPLLLILVCKNDTSHIEMACCLLTGGIIAGLITFGVIEFPMFPQAASLYDINEDAFYWLKAGHVHAIRLLIVYPGVVLSNLFGFETDLGVTIYSASLMILILYFMMRMMYINKIENRISAFAVGLLIITLSCYMNGRLIFVFWGISLLILCEIKFRERKISIFVLQIVTAISVVFAMVSSGTMFITFAYAVMIIPYRWKKLCKASEKKLFIAILAVSAVPIIGIFLPYLIKMIEKNIIFYGGGIQGAINLVNHGLGKIVNTNDKLLVLSLFVIGASVVLANIYIFKHKLIRKDHPDLPLFLLVNLSAYGSIFGLSTGLTGLMPLMVLIIEKINKTFKFV